MLMWYSLPHANKVLFSSAVCDFFILFVHQTSREPLKGFAPNSQGRHVWSLTWTSLNAKVKGQGYQGQICSLLKMHCEALAANHVRQQLQSSGQHAVYVLVKHFCSSFVCLCMKCLGNCRMDLHQIHMEDVFGPSLGRVGMSRSKVKVTRDKKHAMHSITPRQWRNETRTLQITSSSSRWDHSVAVVLVACVWFMFGKTSLALVLPFLLQRYITTEFNFCNRSVLLVGMDTQSGTKELYHLGFFWQC